MFNHALEDYPTWAGIGWAINAGRLITSTESPTAKDTQEDIPITGSAQERYDKLTNFCATWSTTKCNLSLQFFAI